MPTVFQTLDKNGKPHPKWRFKYIDYLNKRRSATGTTSKRETEMIANKIQAEQDAIRKGWRPPPKPCDTPRLLLEVRDEYLAWGKAQGGHGGRPWSKTHLKEKRNKLAFWQERLRLEMVADLIGSLARVEAVLRDLQADGKAGKTIANYAEVIASFCDWLIEREYLAEDPLKRMAKFDTSAQTQRRALNGDEIVRLLAAAPPRRRLLYEVALTSGLRVGELRLLVVGDLDIFANGLRLRPEITKNRKTGFQPLPGWLVDKLAEEAVDRDLRDRLLHVTSEPARNLHQDCAKAGIPRVTAEGKLDFHALRTTYATMIIEAGASVKEAQSLARHSTPGLTLNVYARARSTRLSELAEAIGEGMAVENCPTSVQSGSGGDSADPEGQPEAGLKTTEKGGVRAGSNPAGSGFAGLSKVGQGGTKLLSMMDVTSINLHQGRTASGFAGIHVGQPNCPTPVQSPDAVVGFSGFSGAVA